MSVFLFVLFVVFFYIYIFVFVCIKNFVFFVCCYSVDWA
jgi:hypothetical protein